MIIIYTYAPNYFNTAIWKQEKINETTMTGNGGLKINELGILWLLVS